MSLHREALPNRDEVNDPCPVCFKGEAAHNDEQAEKCDRVFSSWSIERKRAAWRSQRNAVRNYWSAQ